MAWAWTNPRYTALRPGVGDVGGEEMPGPQPMQLHRSGRTRLGPPQTSRLLYPNHDFFLIIIINAAEPAVLCRRRGCAGFLAVLVGVRSLPRCLLAPIGARGAAGHDGTAGVTVANSHPTHAAMIKAVSSLDNECTLLAAGIAIVADRNAAPVAHRRCC